MADLCFICAVTDGAVKARDHEGRHGKDTNWLCIRCGQDASKVGKHIATGLCATCRRHDQGFDIPCRIVRPDPATPWITFCEQHGVKDDMAHHLDMNPGASTD